MQKELKVYKYIQARPFMSLIVGAVILVLGLFLSDIPTMIMSQGWPTTEGSITSQRLIGQKFKEYDGDYFINIDGYIRYQFSVDGISYKGTMHIRAEIYAKRCAKLHRIRINL